jgi:hypothetical protein
MSGKSMSTANKSVVDIISSIVQSICGPVDEILEVVKALFDYPKTDGMDFSGGFFPKTPFFTSTGFEFGCTSKPICER